MTKPVTIPNTFATATTAIPLSQLDSDFSTVATALNDANTYSNYAADTGVANAYVVTLTGISTTYSAGLRIQFKAGNANTGASTLNVNGGGTKNITFQDASSLSSGTIAANAIVDVMYDGTQFLLMNDPAGTVGTGDVVGPSSATANAAAIFDSTTGKLIKDSKVIITPVANSSTLTIANNKTVTVNNTLTLSGTDSTTMTFPSTSATIARTDSAQTFTGVQTFSSNPILSGGTANGVLYLNGSNVATSGSALTFDGTTFQYTGAANFATSTGNVGIGVTSPATKLDVRAAAGSGGFITLVNTTAFANTNVIETSYTLSNSNTGLATAAVIGVTNPGATSNSYGDIYFKTTNPTSGMQERMRLDSSGNLGLGVTPSAWSVGRVLQFQNGASILSYADSAYLNANAYFNSGWKYLGNTASARYEMSSGAHTWYTAPSGTAGNAITFTQAMTLDASGNLGVGETSPSVRLHAANSVAAPSASAGAIAYFDNTNTTSTADTRLVLRSRQTDSSVRERAMLVAEQSGTSGGNLSFWTRPDGNAITERARITSGGYFKASNNGTYAGSTASYNEFYQTNNSDTVRVTNTSSAVSGAYGVYVDLTTDPNATDSFFLRCYGGANQRASIRANGGLANYQANNVNLSDRREKTNFAPAKSYLDTICAIPVQTFNYIDQSEDDPGLTLGVVAQDVQAVAPELVMESNWGTEDNPKMRLSIYQTDLQYALMKCIQEQQALITSLTARVAALEGTQP